MCGSGQRVVVGLGALDFDSGVPDPVDGSGVVDVGGGIAVNEYEVCYEAGLNTAPVRQLEVVCGQ
jgi:hypothetical protein